MKKQTNDHCRSTITRTWLLLAILVSPFSMMTVSANEIPSIQPSLYQGEPLNIQTVLAKRSGSKKKKRRGGGGCQTLSASTLNKKAQAYEKTINSASRKYGVNKALIKSVITVESCFKSRARGTSGEKGLMQLMPGTARRFNVRNGYNIHQNVHGGTKYLSFLLRRYNGDLRKAVAAYNGGEGNVDRVGGVPARNRQYVRKVLKAYGKFSSRVPARQAIPKATAKVGNADIKKATKRKPVKKAVVAATQTRQSLMNQSKAMPTSYRNRQFYKVKNGDTVYAVMRKTGVSVKQLVSWNRLTAPYHLKRGQVLRLVPRAASNNRNISNVVKQIGGMKHRVQSKTYTVRRGDTLYSIARQHGMPVKQLIKRNQLMIPYELKAGQSLQVQ